MIASMDADLKTVEELANKYSGERPLVAFYSQFGLTGGKGSTFDDMCKYLKVNNAAAQVGLGPFDNGTREDLIKSNPRYHFYSFRGLYFRWHYASIGGTALF